MAQKQGNDGVMCRDDNPLPHPDDIHVNVRRNTVEIRGPENRSELDELEHFLYRQAEFTMQLDGLQRSQINRMSDPHKSIHEMPIATDKRALEILAAIIAHRASPATIKRLIDSRQIIVDPERRNPDVEERLERRAARRKMSARG